MSPLGQGQSWTRFQTLQSTPSLGTGTGGHLVQVPWLVSGFTVSKTHFLTQHPSPYLGPPSPGGVTGVCTEPEDKEGGGEQGQAGDLQDAWGCL